MGRDWGTDGADLGGDDGAFDMTGMTAFQVSIDNT